MPPTVVRTSESPINDGGKPLIVKLTDDSGDSGLDWSSVILVLDGRDVTDKKQRTQDGFLIHPEEPFSQGLHKLRISAADYNGNTVERTVFFLVGEKAKTGIVTLRDDGVTMIDGKPFFPIGIYNVSKQDFNGHNLDKALADLKEAGFNFINHYPPKRNLDFQEFLDAAKKYDFKVFISGGGGANDSNLERIAGHIAADRLHPAVIAWYIADDTATYNSPEQIRERTALVRDLAPHLITAHADAPFWENKSRFRQYTTAAPAFLPELYPVRKNTQKDAETSVATIIRDMEECLRDIRLTGAAPVALWPIIQYFKGYASWERFPTAAELRAMSYASLIHGANGITWYTYRSTPKDGNFGVTASPEHWDNICKLATEIKLLTPILIERDAEKQFVPRIVSGPTKNTLGGASITARTKNHAGKIYLFSVNSTTKNVRAEFSAPGIVSGKDYLTNTTVSISKGRFSEEFAPYEVKIFELNLYP